MAESGERIEEKIYPSMPRSDAIFLAFIADLMSLGDVANWNV
jgi:hypothetical protein